MRRLPSKTAWGINEKASFASEKALYALFDWSQPGIAGHTRYPDRLPLHGGGNRCALHQWLGARVT